MAFFNFFSPGEFCSPGDSGILFFFHLENFVHLEIPEFYFFAQSFNF